MNYHALLGTLSGGAWTVTDAPLATNVGSNSTSSFESVSCAGGNCITVGNYYCVAPPSSCGANWRYPLLDALSGGR